MKQILTRLAGSFFFCINSFAGNDTVKLPCILIECDSRSIATEGKNFIKAAGDLCHNEAYVDSGPPQTIITKLESIGYVDLETLCQAAEEFVNLCKQQKSLPPRKATDIVNQLRDLKCSGLRRWNEQRNKQIAKAIVEKAACAIAKRGSRTPQQALCLRFDSGLDANFKKEIPADNRSHFFIRHVAWTNSLPVERGTSTGACASSRGAVPPGHSFFEFDLANTATIDLSCEGQRITATALVSDLATNHTPQACAATSFRLGGSKPSFRGHAAIIGGTLHECSVKAFNGPNQYVRKEFCAKVDFTLQVSRPSVYIPILEKVYILM